MARPLAAMPLEGDLSAATAIAPACEERVTFEGKTLAYRIRGRSRNEGRRQLWIVKGTGADATPNWKLAKQLGVTERYLALLLSGERQPSADVIARAWIVFGIEGQAWGLAPPRTEL